ncbi:uncharacterized protein LAESUDRAFT_231049 [Laetiporus sulphureus 93-53]|uniref:Uncharacterized protein n=1 Tax=Laetiporus sulphureus 93-53 TaxID=1314785 RepID=A0A165DR07_9APHY|nr:uncharacterized protein LAESUDRAFT_231049 [Laetiporus sulphureus 93-53]KZT05441.1 hypothetical protein LAESUDRAFT_231049 [Laetiporus sulphureus 93-53]
MYECRFLGSFPDWRFYSKPRGYIVVILRTVYRTRVRQLYAPLIYACTFQSSLIAYDLSRPSVSSPICPNRWITFRPMHQKFSRVYCKMSEIRGYISHSRPPSRWKRVPWLPQANHLKVKHAFVARGAQGFPIVACYLLSTFFSVYPQAA